MSARLTFASLPWPETAEALGFGAHEAAAGGPLPTGTDGPERVQDGLVLRLEGDWLVFAERWNGPCPEVHRAGDLARPGLWRVACVGSELARIFELPLLAEMRDAEGAEVESGEGDRAEGPSPGVLASCLAWVRATRAGAAPVGWSAPTHGELEAWIDPSGTSGPAGALASRLHVRAGSFLARGELLRDPARLALTFPGLVALPASLPAARRAWIDALLLDAQRRWRCVRFAVPEDGRSVQAEIDLTGVPASIAPALLQLSLDALTGAVRWVLPSLSFLADPSAPSRALERCLPFDSLIEPRLERNPHP